jgi:hypothetical protein
MEYNFYLIRIKYCVDDVASLIKMLEDAAQLTIYNSVRLDINKAKLIADAKLMEDEDSELSDIMESIMDDGLFYHDEHNDIYYHPSDSDTITIHDNYGCDCEYLNEYPYTAPDYFYCDYDNNYYLSDECESIRTEDGFTVYDGNLDNIYEHDGEYYLDESNIPETLYLDNYHNSRSVRISLPNSENCNIFIGFEAEKEDEEIRNSVTIKEFRYLTNEDWRKEADSSLCDESGFELISPIMPLIPDAIKDYISANSVLRRHINADINKGSCGGHITVSKSGYSSTKLFDEIAGYIPIIFSMYYGRLRNSYCSPDTKDNLKYNSGRKSVHLKNDAIEFRIFPAIKNLSQLHFRLRLMEFILSNPTDDYEIAVSQCISNMQLFQSVYSDSGFEKMINRSKVYAIDYEFHIERDEEINELV